MLVTHFSFSPNKLLITAVVEVAAADIDHGKYGGGAAQTTVFCRPLIFTLRLQRRQTYFLNPGTPTTQNACTDS